MERRIGDLELNQELMLDEMLGKQHPLTKIREGGMRGDIGETNREVKAISLKITNGGVHATPQFTRTQKTAMWLVGIPAVTSSVIAIAQALADRG